MIVEVKIKKDENMLSYIKMIRLYSKNLSIGEIKRQIENNNTVIKFDTSGYDFNDVFTKGLTEDDYNFGFYKFLEEIRDKGVKLSIFLDKEQADMQSLHQRLVFEKEIREEIEEYPD